LQNVTGRGGWEVFGIGVASDVDAAVAVDRDANSYIVDVSAQIGEIEKVGAILI